MAADENNAMCAEIGGRKFYFCAPTCMHTFTNPAEELAKLKKRMYVADLAMVLSFISVIANSSLLKRFKIVEASA